MVALLIAACAEAPGSSEFFARDGSSIQAPPDMDSHVPPPDPGGGSRDPDSLDSGLPPFPNLDSSLPTPMPMMDASAPTAMPDVGRDTSTPPPAAMMDARPSMLDATPIPDVSAPPPEAAPPEASAPPPSVNTCSTTPAYATPDACSKCICSKCAAAVASCYASDDATKNEQCKSVRDCAQSNKCTSEACYCGSSPTCLFPDGPCMSVIHTAAGASDALSVQTARDDPSSPVYRSNQVGTCQLANCATECGLR